jgi:hypothetical protein
MRFFGCKYDGYHTRYATQKEMNEYDETMQLREDLNRMRAERDILQAKLDGMAHEQQWSLTIGQRVFEGTSGLQGGLT